MTVLGDIQILFQKQSDLEKRMVDLEKKQQESNERIGILEGLIDGLSTTTRNLIDTTNKIVTSVGDGIIKLVPKLPFF